ncbi:RNA-directed DNA polymerase from mobile element jockey-like [Elysia marginata]|uniref:RNA-directed DNA polymerase from mobile element jockey-like n=1 Tax=Elysia marginata TaxID=1093978 RepID=A0AAV4HSN6_9GAST|nr:RNA-directed DNA polymerase from mobile element jockey-like [Elysia marginata]
MRQQDCEKKSILRKFARTTWGTSQSALLTSTLAMCYSAAEYCAPVWTISPNTKLVDVKLYESMRTIGGLFQINADPVASYHKLKCTSPHQARRCDTENNKKNQGYGRQQTFETNIQGGPNKKTEVKKPLLKCKD